MNIGIVSNGTKLGTFNRLRRWVKCRLIGNFADLNSKQAALLTTIPVNLVPLGIVSAFRGMVLKKFSSDGRINSLFKVSAVADLTVPKLRGKTEKEVILASRKLELNLSKVEEQASKEPQNSTR